MSRGEPLRRAFPPPRRRPTVFDVLIRWRVEIVALAAVGFAIRGLGATLSCLLAFLVAAVIATVPAVRQAALGLALAVVVPHRVRSALVQSGVANRDGKLPWLVFARTYGEVVVVHVWLRAGVTWEDLDRAVPVIRGACGAVDVQVARSAARYDRAVVMVARPRWGWPGR
jgi:hypothetical protein